MILNLIRKKILYMLCILIIIYTINFLNLQAKNALSSIMKKNAVIIRDLNITSSFPEKIKVESNFIIAPEHRLDLSPMLFDGFSYDNWKNSDLIPRVLTKKEHTDFMNLIGMVAKIFSLNKIEFMIGGFIY